MVHLPGLTRLMKRLINTLMKRLMKQLITLPLLQGPRVTLIFSPFVLSSSSPGHCLVFHHRQIESKGFTAA